jgi:Methyltransferase domain
MIDIELFTINKWQMAIGQRAALEGLLAQLKPEVSVEVGTAQGGSLSRIAAHSGHVHSFDLAFDVDRSGFDNVTFHEGDSHVLLPRVLSDLERRGENVDFALVDGDYSYEGAKRDLENLLASPAVSRTVIVLHDTMNEDVRAGIESVDFESCPKVVFTELDFVLQYQDASPLQELWGGLGLVVVDAGQTNYRIFDDSIILRGRGPKSSAERSIAWRSATPLRSARRRARKVVKRALGRGTGL